MDDQAPIPMAPDIPDLEIVEAEANHEDLKLAQAYWHPAWAKVQDLLEEKVESYRATANALVMREKPADEFKIQMLVAATVTSELNNLMEDIRRAVESVESTGRTGDQ